MIRRIITIDEEKCNGCGLCADACHEGAIGIVDGKAKLLRDKGVPIRKRTAKWSGKRRPAVTHDRPREEY